MGLQDANAAELDANQKEWLYMHYVECKQPKDIAETFGISVQDFYVVKNTPAANKYAQSLVFSTRDTLNLLSASKILEQLQAANVAIPLDLLIKIYNATTPKAAPIGFQLNIDTLIKEAEAVADRYNLDGESRKTMIDFVKRKHEMTG